MTKEMTESQTAPQTTAAPSTKAAPKPAARPRRKVLPLIVLVLGVAAFFIWRGYFANPRVPDSIVTVSGISNTVVLRGHCKSLTLSGAQNSITVDAVDSIEVSGFNNQVIYHTGSPSIENSGAQNVVQQG